MPTLLDLAERMEARAKTFEPNANAMVKKAISEAAKTLIYVTTRVDTSKAISNWSIGLSGPVPAPAREPYVPGRFGSTKGQSAPASFAVAEKVLEGRKLNSTTYLSNPAHYINYIDDGFGPAALLTMRSVIKNYPKKLL